VEYTDLDSKFFEQFETLTEEEAANYNGGWSAMSLVRAWSNLTPFFEDSFGPLIGAGYTSRSYYKTYGI
jgi:hypothetical protein